MFQSDSDRSLNIPNFERNIEIKAKLSSVDDYEHKLSIAKDLCGINSGERIIQRDVFFKTVKSGVRMKLRYMRNGKCELIVYDREDIAGPKLSNFDKTDVAEPEILERQLTLSNGKRGVLHKLRNLFIFGESRIHIDKVEGLGYFIEIEVCLENHQDEDEGEIIIRNLMDIFLIADSSLIHCSYFDMLQKRYADAAAV